MPAVAAGTGTNRPMIANDIDASRGWIADQAGGVQRIADRVARAGFDSVLHGAP